MRRDVNAFRERFKRWQAGEQVYDKGQVVHAAMGLDGEEVTDAIQRRQLPLEYQGVTRRTTADINQERLAEVMARNQASVVPAQHVPQQLQDYYRQKDETARWAAQKKAVEEGTDEMMKAIVSSVASPEALVMGGAIGGAIKGVGAVAKAVPKIVKAVKNWRPIVPSNPDRYYRIVGEVGDPIGDAIRSGVIRGPGANPTAREALQEANNASGKISLAAKAHSYPMFAKGSTWKGSNSRAAGDSGKPFVIRSKEDTGPIVWEESNKDFRHKGHSGIFRPSFFGDVNASPTQYFEYWEPLRFGYMRREFPTLDIDPAVTPRGLLSNEPLIAKGTVGGDIYRMEGGNDVFKKWMYDKITHSSLEQLLRDYPDIPSALYDGLVVDKPTPEELRQIFNNSVLPRMRNMRAGWHGGLLRPTVKSNVDAALDRGYTVYDKTIWDKSSWKDFAGFQNSETGHIAIRDGLEDFALGHEYRHRLDGLLPKSSMESDILEGAYDLDFLRLSEYYPELEGVRMAPEAVTTNFDARLNAIGKYHLLNTDWRLQNKIINKLSDDKIIDAVRKANGYGRRYIEWLEQNGKLATDAMKKAFADKHRDAMRFVGAFGVPTVLSVPQLNK